MVACRPLSLRANICQENIFAAIVTDLRIIEILLETGFSSNLPAILVHIAIPRLPRGSNNRAREVVRRINRGTAVLYEYMK